MREQSKPDLVVGHGASTIGTPDYVPPNEVEKLREAVPRAVNALADAMEEVARLKQAISDLEKSGSVICSCGKRGATYGPDPYASDINDDDTPVWECGDCRHESAMDV